MSVYISFIFIQSLFFKFAGAPEPIHIFSTLDGWARESFGLGGLFFPSGLGAIFGGAIFNATDFDGTNDVDEQVVLPGPAMQQFFRRLFDHVSTMNARNFNNALARTARQFGHTEEEICEMFSLHAGVPGEPGIPGTPDYTTCPDMVDRAALDTTRIPPSTPTGIVVRRNPSDPSIATIEWEDLSLVATGFSFRITGEDGLDRTRSVPYARNASVDQTGLAGDTEYTVTITTLNGDGEASTTTTFVTFALPPEGVMASPGPGSATLTWMPPPRARGYQISRVAPDVATLFTTTEPTAQVRGLSDDLDDRFAEEERRQVEAVGGEVDEGAAAGALGVDAPVVAVERVGGPVGRGPAGVVDAAARHRPEPAVRDAPAAGGRDARRRVQSASPSMDQTWRLLCAGRRNQFRRRARSHRRRERLAAARSVRPLDRAQSHGAAGAGDVRRCVRAGHR